MAAIDSAEYQYKVFSVIGGPFDFEEFLQQQADRGWDVVNAGLARTDGRSEWFAIMRRPKQ